ncbi:hypothetical protein DBR20_15510 [Stenotrophomonas sp. HMWF023]|nr:hypothetical protein DBR20_15510 [Stenotrophomonas sp. HMWF023]
MTDKVWLIGLSVGVFSFLLSLSMYVYTKSRAARYDEKLKRIELEMFRKSIEDDITELNDRLMSTEARWKDANHLLISSQDMITGKLAGSQGGRRSPFLEGEIDGRVDERMVFVLTPFSEVHSDTYSAISLACMQMGLRAVRGDEEFIRGEVFPHVLDLIKRAGIVVANIDGRNPNVFYELGIAQALGKRTILVSRRPRDVPFDVRTNRIVVYSSMDDLSRKLQLELARAMVDSVE